MKGLPSLLALAAFGLASAPVAAQNPQPADKPAEPAKIRRAETIVDDNWTVTCALTDQTGAKKQCSAVLKIAQTDKSGAQRVVFSWVLAKLVSVGKRLPSIGANLSEIILNLPQYDCALVNVAVSIVGCGP